MDKTIQLRDGGRYRLRNGRIVTIMHNTYQWIDDDGKTYMDNGRYSKNAETDIDIIAEVTDDKEEKNVDFTIDVGKFYECDDHHKWECLHIHGKVAFMAHNITSHQLFDIEDKLCFFSRGHIIGPWVEPLAIKWDMVPQEYDRIRVADIQDIAAFGRSEHEYMSQKWMDHIAPGWRDHIGETHYRDGRVERSES